jgi:hypothetical protein
MLHKSVFLGILKIWHYGHDFPDFPASPVYRFCPFYPSALLHGALWSGRCKAGKAACCV